MISVNLTYVLLTDIPWLSVKVLNDSQNPILDFFEFPWRQEVPCVASKHEIGEKTEEFFWSYVLAIFIPPSLRLQVSEVLTNPQPLKLAQIHVIYFM